MTDVELDEGSAPSSSAIKKNNYIISSYLERFNSREDSQISKILLPSFILIMTDSSPALLVKYPPTASSQNNSSCRCCN